MKICLVGPTYPFRGGISHYTTLLSRELGKRHRVQVVSLRKQYPRLLFPGQTQTDESREILAVDNEPLLVPWNPWTWVRAYRKIARLDPDLVIFQWWHPFFAPCFGTLARWLRGRARVRTCFLVHNALAHERSALEGMLTRYAFRGPLDFIAHSEEDRAAIRRIRPAAGVRVGPHPTYDFFQAGEEISMAGARERLSLPSGEILLFFGYVRRYKGLPVLIRALPKVLERRDCRLLVVGEFYHDRRATLDLIRDLRLQSRVILVDRYVPNEEVRLYFRASDLVVLPYLTASQSGVAQIAFGSQTPVIASRVGGLPEVIEDGVTGLLVPPGDPNALAGAILRFFEQDLADRMVRNIGRNSDRFGWDRMVGLIEDIANPSAPERATPARPTPYAVDRR